MAAEKDKPQICGPGPIGIDKKRNHVVMFPILSVSELNIQEETDMNYGFIKLSRACEKFISSDPLAFQLLSLIAVRAIRELPTYNPKKIKIGESFVSDYRSYGMTEQTYREAKSRLKELGYASFRTTTKGTFGSLISNEIFDINIGVQNQGLLHEMRVDNGESNGVTTDKTTDKPLKNQIPKSIEYKPVTESTVINVESRQRTEQSTSNGQRNAPYIEQEVKNKEYEYKNIPSEYIAQSPAVLRNADSIRFDFESGIFVGITDEDRSAWAIAYPGAKIDQEVARAGQWCRSNPGKSKSRKLWRKMLTTWLSKASEQSTRLGAYSPKPTDHRQQLNPDGTAISAYAEAF